MAWVRLLFIFTSKNSSHNHDLDSELIITLTSYKARFKYLDLTLKCLLSQSVKADKVLLWVAEEDYVELPEKVIELKDRGLEIRKTSDIRSYKKIIPALREFPNAAFFIVDDDLFYSRTMVERFIAYSKSFPGSVIAGRVHEVQFDDAGGVLPYKSWKWDSLNKCSDNNFFTGCGGVFFPPCSFAEETLNQKMFLKLAPFADDVWLNWMLRLNNKRVVPYESRFQFWDWPSTQKQSLHSHNVKGKGNDGQISKVIAEYGQCYFKEKNA